MISYKNILFDMGNVLVTYNPEWVIRRYTEDEELIREVKNIVFNSQEWFLLDAGLIEEEKAERNWMERLSSDKARELAHLSFLFSLIWYNRGAFKIKEKNNAQKSCFGYGKCFSHL